jgi:N-acetylglutamate synthase-like GNAT family acetyltransferase
VFARRLRYFHLMLAIRLADAADHAAIVALVHEAYAVYVPRIGRPPAPMLEDYGALIAEGRVHVLEDETGIAGIVVLIPEAHAMLLDNVAVKVAAQGRGYGHTLIAFAEATARAADYATIRLFTNERMTENLARYPRLGYVETHRNEEDGLRRVHFSKQL